MSGCANQQPPGGGNIDTIPPKVIETYPENGSLNFSDDYVQFEFSEYIQKNSLREAFFISPSIDGAMDFSWTNKTVTINFPEPLRKNTTYVVSIGTDIVDYNNRNRMANSYTLTFSTGSQIDKRIITGKIFSTKADGILVFAYKNEGQTINPANEKPQYITQTGSDGSFRIAGLSAGDYRIFAIKDQYKDYLFHPNQDDYGVYNSDVKINESDSAISGINFKITKRDTIPPRILSATMTDEFHILAKFSKEFEPSIINKDNFYIYDSTANKKIFLRDAFKGTVKTDELALVVNERIPIQDQAYLFVRTIVDKAGNSFTEDFSGLTISDKPDTSKPGVIKAEPVNGNVSASLYNQKFDFYFNDAFDSTIAKTGILFEDTLGNNYSYNINFIDNGSFQIIPFKSLESSTTFKLKFDLSKFFDQSGNHYDSTYVYQFTTVSDINYTGLSGIILNYDTSKTVRIILEDADSPGKQIITSPDKKGNFGFNKINPGDYSLWCFYDENNNGEYDYGWPYPFKPSEEFIYYPSMITLKPRWVVTDVKFDLDIAR